jgi:hypothetical protein
MSMADRKSLRISRGVLKKLLQAAQKDLRDEACGKLTSGDVLSQYAGARQSSATKYMRLFQRPAGHGDEAGYIHHP